MEDRRFKRIGFKLNAEINLSGKRYKGSIENLSEGGLFEIIFSEADLTDLATGASLGVKFEIPSEEIIDLHCKIVWIRVGPEQIVGLRYYIGLEIINPSPEYKEFIKTRVKEY